ncbi:hypothetical protein NDU88_004764 [Pleurodeles waltl]|uniref:Uncharacterized protein n=1 Tax=Pleurodeles waltl TaxID=8319 RepID=A0AAV7W9X6_PLEWA|nr:hypothetical protein NDU88_004764 [Pleurodeles waltl]
MEPQTRPLFSSAITLTLAFWTSASWFRLFLLAYKEVASYSQDQRPASERRGSRLTGCSDAGSANEGVSEGRACQKSVKASLNHSGSAQLWASGTVQGEGAAHRGKKDQGPPASATEPEARSREFHLCLGPG